LTGCTSQCQLTLILLPFQEDVIGNNDGSAAVLFQDGEDVLEKVELFVARARPEIVSMHDDSFRLYT